MADPTVVLFAAVLKALGHGLKRQGLEDLVDPAELHRLKDVVGDIEEAARERARSAS